MHKKKIIFVMYNLEIGGAEKSLISILNNFDYEKYDVDLFLYEHKGELLQQLPDRVNLLPQLSIYATLCKSTKETFKSGYIKLAYIRAMAKYFARYKKIPLAYDQYMNRWANKMLNELEGQYDVAISNIWPHDFVQNKVKAKKKIGWLHTDYSQMKIDYKIDGESLRSLDYIVTVSDKCKDSIITIHPYLEDKIQVIENIVSEDLIKKLGEESVEEKAIYEKKAVKLLTVARLHKEKGVDRVCEVLKLLWEDKLDVEWYVIGYGAEEQNIINQAKLLGVDNRLHMLGKKVNPYPYMKACDIYVQPSRFEGKAITITEAKIFKKPILITEYNSARDQINHMENGLIVDNSEIGIYEGVKKIIFHENLAKKFQQELCKTSESNIDEIKKIYELL